MAKAPKPAGESFPVGGYAHVGIEGTGQGTLDAAFTLTYRFEGSPEPCRVSLAALTGDDALSEAASFLGLVDALMPPVAWK